MLIDDKKLLLGFYMNREREADGLYHAGIGVTVTRENFNLSCDQLYTHVVEGFSNDDRWVFLFSVMYSVVQSIKEKHPEIIEGMAEL